MAANMLADSWLCYSTTQCERVLWWEEPSSPYNSWECGPKLATLHLRLAPDTRSCTEIQLQPEGQWHSLGDLCPFPFFPCELWGKDASM